MNLKISVISDRTTRWENSGVGCDRCFAEKGHKVHKIIYQIKDDSEKSMWLCQKHYDIFMLTKKVNPKLTSFEKMFLKILTSESGT